MVQIVRGVGASPSALLAEVETLSRTHEVGVVVPTRAGGAGIEAALDASALSSSSPLGAGYTVLTWPQLWKSVRGEGGGGGVGLEGGVGGGRGGDALDAFSNLLSSSSMSSLSSSLSSSPSPSPSPSPSSLMERPEFTYLGEAARVLDEPSPSLPYDALVVAEPQRASLFDLAALAALAKNGHVSHITLLTGDKRSVLPPQSLSNALAWMGVDLGKSFQAPDTADPICPPEGRGAVQPEVVHAAYRSPSGLVRGVVGEVAAAVAGGAMPEDVAVVWGGSLRGGSSILPLIWEGLLLEGVPVDYSGYVPFRLLDTPEVRVVRSLLELVVDPGSAPPWAWYGLMSSGLFPSFSGAELRAVDAAVASGTVFSTLTQLDGPGPSALVRTLDECSLACSLPDASLPAVLADAIVSRMGDPTAFGPDSGQGGTRSAQQVANIDAFLKLLAQQSRSVLADRSPAGLAAHVRALVASRKDPFVVPASSPRGRGDARDSAGRGVYLGSPFGLDLGRASVQSVFCVNLGSRPAGESIVRQARKILTQHASEWESLTSMLGLVPRHPQARIPDDVPTSVLPALGTLAQSMLHVSSSGAGSLDPHLAPLLGVPSAAVTSADQIAAKAVRTAPEQKVPGHGAMGRSLIIPEEGGGRARVANAPWVQVWHDMWTCPARLYYRYGVEAKPKENLRMTKLRDVVACGLDAGLVALVGGDECGVDAAIEAYEEVWERAGFYDRGAVGVHSAFDSGFQALLSAASRLSTGAGDGEPRAGRGDVVEGVGGGKGWICSLDDNVVTIGVIRMEAVDTVLRRAFRDGIVARVLGGEGGGGRDVEIWEMGSGNRARRGWTRSLDRTTRVLSADLCARVEAAVESGGVEPSPVDGARTCGDCCFSHVCAFHEQ